MCYNSPAITAETTRLANIIGSEIKKNTDQLNAQGKDYLFMGVIAGWETRMLDDSQNPHVDYGYCALHNLGYSASNPPPDIDLALQEVVSNWIIFWDKGLEAAGIPKEKVFTHIAFPVDKIPPGMDAATFRTLEMKNIYKDSDPNVTAFNDVSYPGFSIYGAQGGLLFPAVYAGLDAHGDPPWGVAEGTDMDLASTFSANGATSGVLTMEQYLGQVFNHGGIYVDLFGLNTGVADTFEKVTAGPSSIAAYRKFLSGEILSEGTAASASPPSVSSGGNFRDKLLKIQNEMPAWMKAHPGRQPEAAPLLQKLNERMEASDMAGAEQAADRILNFIEEK